MHPFSSRAAFVAVALVASASVASADLDAAQQKLLADAGKHVDQGETNLRVAKDGLGTGAVTPSKARLALTRLESVKTSIAQAEARLEKLPKGEASVEAVRTRTVALADAVKALETALTGGAKAPATSTPAGGATVPLDYRQRESLKNATFHAREVTGKAAAIAEIATEIGKAADPLRVDRRRVASGVATLEDARRKAKNAQDHLGALPANGAGVTEVAAELASAVASLDASEKVVAPLYAKLTSLLDPATYPALAADRKRLGELAAMYADAQLFERDRVQAAAALGELREAVKEHDRIVSLYALLIDQKTEEGERLSGASRHFRERLDAFVAAAKVVKAELPAAIDAALAEVSRMADQAVAEQKPAFFGGGIPQAVAEAVDRIALLAAFDAEAAKAKTASLDALRATLKQQQASLRGAIIAANAPAEDRYAGDDRAALENLAVAAWKKLQGDANVKRVVIPSAAWKRETTWRYRSGWVLEDRSRLQIQLLVGYDEKLVVVRPINLVKDHTQADQIEAYPMDGPKDEVDAQRLIPIEKVR